MNYVGKYLSLIKVTYMMIPESYSTLVSPMKIISHYINQIANASSSLVFDQTLPVPITSPDYVYTAFLNNIDMSSNSLSYGI